MNNNEMYCCDRKDSLKQQPSIADLDTELDFGQVLCAGYDVLKKAFFISQSVPTDFRDKPKKVITFFNSFEEYYLFLRGEIYQNTCYFGYLFSEEEKQRFNLDEKRINSTSLINYDISMYDARMSSQERQEYETKELIKLDLEKWSNKLISCSEFSEFAITVNSFQQTYSSTKYLDFLLYSYVYNNPTASFEFIMRWFNLSTDRDFAENLSLIYGAQTIINSYNPRDWSQANAKRKKKRLEFYLNYLQELDTKTVTKSYFDEFTHYFVYETDLLVGSDVKLSCKRYFYSVSELVAFLNRDLSECDLSGADIIDFDFSNCCVGPNTQLPIVYERNLQYNVGKRYDRVKNVFIVEQTWHNKHGKTVKMRLHEFDFFFDFVYFLKGDLSDADLLFCKGLENVSTLATYVLTNARLKSPILESLKMSYQKFPISPIREVDVCLNEEQQLDVVRDGDDDNFSYAVYQKYFYISDIHLLHRLNNANAKSEDDVVYEITSIVDDILSSIVCTLYPIIFIAGDTSTDIKIFQLFVETLRANINEKFKTAQVVFVLGNHEFWNFANCSIEQTVKSYLSILQENGMYLLHNSMLLKNDNNTWRELSYSTLNDMSVQDLRNTLIHSRLIWFGGVGFSGQNQVFNADNNIYNSAIAREQELIESKKTSNIYNKLREAAYDRTVIVLTHMPLSDWNECVEPQANWVYVSGHTHRNSFHDDGVIRVFCDNQIGYKRKNGCYLKSFYAERIHDIFCDYSDGIFSITADEYKEFCYAKGLGITFNRDFNNLYMIKRNGYYMFVIESKKNTLNILHGGAIKRLNYPLEYLYENMPAVIETIKKPLDEYSKYQKTLSAEIKKIGGSGNIHGSIIDIDWFNHIYVNPLDGSIVPYFAFDIVHKYVYKDLLSLLEDKSPELLGNYLLLSKTDANSPLLKKDVTPQKKHMYLNTDIYKSSRTVKKLQRLDYNILTTWPEVKTKKTRKKLELKG